MEQQPSFGGVISSLMSMCFFWGFFIVKLWGTAFTMWSWFWLFLPFVPWAARFLSHFNLL